MEPVFLFMFIILVLKVYKIHSLFFAILACAENGFSYFVDILCLYSDHRHRKGKIGESISIFSNFSLCAHGQLAG